MKYMINAEAKKIVGETADSLRSLLKLFPPEKESPDGRVSFVGEEISEMRVTLTTLAEKLENIQYHPTILDKR